MKILRTFLALSCLFALVSAAPAGTPIPEPVLDGFDEYVNISMNNWLTAGLAIGVIRNDQIVLSKGYGVRRASAPDAVDANTIFAIGSCTKAFTAAALAMLVDEGKLGWDDRVIDRMPSFRLYDPYETREVRLRDLLTHRIGLERNDLLAYGSPLGSDELLRRVRFIKPAWGFRSKFGYQNLMYLAAGQMIPTITGKSWAEFVRERIFIPLGMSSTSIGMLGLALDESGNIASPHVPSNVGPHPVPWRNIDSSAPAGAINSNVTDMLKWIHLMLKDGVAADKRLLTHAAIEEMHMPQTLLRLDGKTQKGFPEAHFLAYGLGWFLHDFRGRKVIEHGGNIDGMTAVAALVPEEQLGLVILCNSDSSRLPSALMYRILDAYIPGVARDWSSDFLNLVQELGKPVREAEEKYRAARQKDTHPSLALGKYEGKYESDIYPEVVITKKGNELAIEFGTVFKGSLSHWHFDTFVPSWEDPYLQIVPHIYVNFRLNSLGEVEDLKLNTAAPGMISEMIFRRKLDASAAKSLP